METGDVALLLLLVTNRQSLEKSMRTLGIKRIAIVISFMYLVFPTVALAEVGATFVSEAQSEIAATGTSKTDEPALDVGDAEERTVAYGVGVADEGARETLSDTVRERLDNLAATNMNALADGTYVIRALCSKSGVLDVCDGSLESGANVQLWASNSTDGQRWVVVHDDMGYLTLTNAGSGKVLESSGVKAFSGLNVEQWATNDGWNQKWIAVPLSDGSGFTLVSALDPNLVLDVCGGLGRNGDNVQLWDAIGSRAQAFLFEECQTDRERLDQLAAENANTLESGTYVIRALCSDRGVVEIDDGSSKNGGNAQLWPSNGGANQKWRVTVDGYGYVTLINVASGKALDVSGGKACSGDNVVQWSANGGWNQKWIAVAEDTGGVRLYSAARRGVSLDACSGSGKQGDNIQVWESIGSKAQSFEFVNANPVVSPCDEGAVGDGWWVVSPASTSGLALDVNGASRSVGANVQLWSENGTQGQAFRFVYSDGYYMVINSGSGLALDVAGSDVVSGANVSQWTSSVAANRQFSVVVNEDGTYTLVNKATGLALDFGDGSSGSNVCAKELNSSVSQRFNLKAVSCPIVTGYYHIGVDSGESAVVDLANSSAKDGAGCVVWRRSGNLNQRWFISAVSGREGAYTIESMSSAKRLCANSDGSISQKAANDSDESQIWIAQACDGFVTFESAKYLGKRLDVTGGGSANGTKIGLWSANSSGAQRFVLIRASGEMPSGTFHVRASSNFAQVLDVAQGSMADCANVLSWENNDGGNQKWNVRRNSDGTYSFENCETGKVLDLANGSTASGSNVIQYASNAGKNQRWRIEYVSGGWKVTSALSSSAILTISGGARSGANVCISDSSSVSTQRFTFGATTYIPSNQKAMVWKAQNYYSGTNWLILADTTNNKVAVFSGSRGNWSIRKFWDCTSGAYSTPTVTGEFTVGSRGYSFGEEHGYSCYYWTQFYGAYLFHSVKYYANTRNIMDGRLGVNASAGCLRLQIENAKWIYDTIPRGTKVVVYR